MRKGWQEEWNLVTGYYVESAEKYLKRKENTKNQYLKKVKNETTK